MKKGRSMIIGKEDPETGCHGERIPKTYLKYIKKEKNPSPKL